MIQPIKLCSIKKLLLIAIFFTIAMNSARAQTSTADSAKAALLSIDSVYRNAFYLSFDVKIIYDSDTLYANTDSADYTYSEMLGHYTFNGNKALYLLGDIEYMRNDSFMIGVYKENKILLVGKPDSSTTSSFLPTKAILDSMLTLVDSTYECNINDEGNGDKCLFFTATDSTLSFKDIHIDYDPSTYYITKITYKMVEDFFASDPNGATDPTPQKRTVLLTFNFLNHRVDQIDPAVFSETKYLFFDGPNEIVPTAGYKDFTIYKNF